MERNVLERTDFTLVVELIVERALDVGIHSSGYQAWSTRLAPGCEQRMLAATGAAGALCRRNMRMDLPHKLLPIADELEVACPVVWPMLAQGWMAS